MSLQKKLEKLHALIINEEHEKAEALFHEAFVEAARSVHKNFMEEEDWMSDDSFDENDVDEATDEIEDEEMFSEDEFEDDDDVEDVEVDDMDSEDEDDMDSEDDFEDDDMEDVDAEEGDIEDRLEDLEDEIERLTAEFDSLMSTEEGEHDMDIDGDGEIEGDDDMEVDAEDDLESEMEVEEDVDGHGYGAGPKNDGHAGNGGKPGDRRKMPSGAHHRNDDKDGVYEEDDLEEAFDELDESFELEDISNENSEDLIGTGGKQSFSPNAPANTVLPKKSANTLDAKPHKVGEGPTHKGYDREDAPSTSKMKARKNVRGKSTDDTSSVAKEGDTGAALNKDYAGNKGNQKSPYASVKNVTESKKAARRAVKK